MAALKHRRREGRRGYVVAKGTASASRKSQGSPATGTFGAHRRPKVVGVDPNNAILIRDLARRARRAEREWLKTLPKGVTV